MNLVETYRKKTGKVLKCAVCGNYCLQLDGHYVPGKTEAVKACGQCAKKIIDEYTAGERAICKQCDPKTFSNFSLRHDSDGHDSNKCLSCRYT